MRVSTARHNGSYRVSEGSPSHKRMGRHRNQSVLLLLSTMFSLGGIDFARGRPVCGQLGTQQRSKSKSLWHIPVQLPAQSPLKSGFGIIVEREGYEANDISRMLRKRGREQAGSTEEKKPTFIGEPGDISTFIKKAEPDEQNFRNPKKEIVRPPRSSWDSRREHQDTEISMYETDRRGAQPPSGGPHRAEDARKGQARHRGDGHQPEILDRRSTARGRRREFVKLHRSVSKTLGTSKVCALPSRQGGDISIGNFLRPT